MSTEETIYVVAGLKADFLGLPVVISLQLVPRVEANSTPTLPTTIHPDSLQEEVEVFIESLVLNLPTTEDRLQGYREAQADNLNCSGVMQFCKERWPNRCPANISRIPYWRVESQLSVYNGLLMYNSRVVIPSIMQRDVLIKIHEEHQEITRCKLRANSSVWWQGISRQLVQMIQHCCPCHKDSRGVEDLIPTELPDYPFQVVGSDLLEFRGVHYLIMVDYFSIYPELIRLSSTTSSSIIHALKAILARHGIPEILKSDNGPQYSSNEMREFATTYGFTHITSSPRYPQSNGLAEKMVKLLNSYYNDPGSTSSASKLQDNTSSMMQHQPIRTSHG
ncbi:uncharacterized protein K02A2.6-like [Corticium candelabrum]|uniref:uncharacterized protein K02A2.6-like n=1 Tax=Corticium candelabrum TaxID=121492 RepID=UPI002E264671|nr:uncharacterized protein K02A2.6-like [Corticium candelabrum]